MGKKLAARLAGHTITAHTLTHAHPDHVGGSKAVVDALGVPFWAPAGDAPAIDAGQAVQKDTPIRPLLELGARFKPVPIARHLVEGDEVAGFTVLDAPGHSPGHIAFWRESDRTLIAGDVWFNINFLTLKPGLRAPLKLPTVDPARNRESMQRLLELGPRTVGLGHGPVITDAASKLRVV
jgi:glyoxylase-like metal-dependent hydrolase (beta-lactamase superfamily II)